MKLYKLLNDNNTALYTGFNWDVSGKWMRSKGEIKLCHNGFHVLRKADIIYWLSFGFNLYEVEIKGHQINGCDAICARSVRVIRKVNNYNKENLLKTVIKPAVERAHKYAVYADRAANYADRAGNCLSDFAASYVGSAANLAAESAAAASAADAEYVAAVAAAASAAASAARAGNLFAVAEATDAAADAADVAGEERNQQAKDLEPLLN